MEETRVGYAATDCMLDIILEHVKDQTVEGRYQGELFYLNLAQQFRTFLRDEDPSPSETVLRKLYGIEKIV